MATKYIAAFTVHYAYLNGIIKKKSYTKGPLMNIGEILGLAGAFCTTISFVPQVVKVCRTRSTHDISLGMFLIFFIGVIFWLIYGIMTKALPLIAANTVTFFLSGIILAYKVKYK
jgi:MtN3 and saliva related transmembrane protein